MKLNNMTLPGQGIAQPESSQGGIFKADEQDISVIKFEGVKVRVVNIHGEPWFIAADVCKALETDNPTKAVKALDADEKTLTSIQGIHAGPGNPVVNAVSESGFYKLISRSRKATTPGTFAHSFTNWVFRDVIPSIRKTGSYGVAAMSFPRTIDILIPCFPHFSLIPGVIKPFSDNAPVIQTFPDGIRNNLEHRRFIVGL